MPPPVRPTTTVPRDIELHARFYEAPTRHFDRHHDGVSDFATTPPAGHWVYVWARDAGGHVSLQYELEVLARGRYCAVAITSYESSTWPRGWTAHARAATTELSSVPLTVRSNGRDLPHYALLSEIQLPIARLDALRDQLQRGTCQRTVTLPLRPPSSPHCYARGTGGVDIALPNHLAEMRQRQVEYVAALEAWLDWKDPSRGTPAHCRRLELYTLARTLRQIRAQYEDRVKYRNELVDDDAAESHIAGVDRDDFRLYTALSRAAISIESGLLGERVCATQDDYDEAYDPQLDAIEGWLAAVTDRWQESPDGMRAMGALVSNSDYHRRIYVFNSARKVTSGFLQLVETFAAPTTTEIKTGRVTREVSVRDMLSKRLEFDAPTVAPDRALGSHAIRWPATLKLVDTEEIEVERAKYGWAKAIESHKVTAAVARAFEIVNLITALESLGGMFAAPSARTVREFLSFSSAVVDALAVFKPRMVTRFGVRAVPVLNVVGGVLDAVTGAWSAADEASSGDYDAAWGHGITAAGGVISAVGGGLMLTGVGAFAGGILAAIGLLISGVGWVIVYFCDEADIDRWLKHCSFGRRAANPDTDPLIVGGTTYRFTTRAWKDSPRLQLEALAKVAAAAAEDD